MSDLGWSTSRAALAVAALGAVVSVSCSATPLTQLVVDIQIDPGVMAALTSVDLVVTSPSGQRTTETFVPGTLGAAPSIGIVWHGGRLDPVTLEARGHGAPVVDRVITGFVVGQTRLVVLVLGPTCAPACCSTERCSAGRCVDATVPAIALPTFDGTIPQLDAGPPDAFVADGLSCIFSWQCPSLDDLCASDATGHGHCIGAVTVTGGMPCAHDLDCYGGSCDPVTGSCRYACDDNSDCDPGMSCVATGAARGHGACFADAPCTTCSGVLALTIDGVTPFCTPGHACVNTSGCTVDGLECTWSGASQPFGDIGWCVPILAGHPVCAGTEFALTDASGTAYCTDFTMCASGSTICPSGQQCIAGTQFGFPAARVAHGESICARPR